MKMQYSRKTKTLSPVTTLIGVGIAVVVALLLLLRIFFPSALTSLISPLSHVGTSGVSFIHAFSAGEQMREERDRLREENEALTREIARLTSETKRTPEQAGITAGVLSRPPMTPYDVLIVNAGSTQGVSVGSLVHALGVPVGVVVRVGMSSSHVRLYSASGASTEGWLGEARLPVTVVGEGAGALSAETPRELPVAVGDVVYLPGPGALPVGTVRLIESNPASPSQTLYIEPFINPFTLTDVEIHPSV